MLTFLRFSEFEGLDTIRNMAEERIEFDAIYTKYKNIFSCKLIPGNSAIFSAPANQLGGRKP